MKRVWSIKLRFGIMGRTMNTAVLDEENRLKKLVKDYFGDFVTARKTIEELENTLQDKTFFKDDQTLVVEDVISI